MRSHLLVAALLLVSISQSFAAGCPDADVFSTDPLSIPSKAKWRGNITNKSTDGSIAPTTIKREKEMKQSVADQYETIKGGATPGMEFYPANKVGWDYLRQSPGYGSHITDQWEISNLGESGILEGTLILPVSGHVGFDKAQAWATTDTYSIQYRDGAYDHTWNFFQNVKNYVTDAKSLGFTTIQEVKLQLVKGKVVTLIYNRRGSAGPGGYVEGRVLELVWDGT